jgi:hypothetical protein
MWRFRRRIVVVIVCGLVDRENGKFDLKELKVVVGGGGSGGLRAFGSQFPALISCVEAHLDLRGEREAICGDRVRKMAGDCRRIG